MLKTLAGAIALACAASAVAGCATVVHGTAERVQIDSTPGGAEVTIDDSDQSVVTPSAVMLARGKGHKLVFRKPGFQDATEHLTSTPSGWILGNVIAGGVVGMAIDASNGAARKLSSDKVFVTLTPLPPSPAKADETSPRQPQAAEIPGPHSAAFRALENALQPDPGQPEIESPRPQGPPPDSFSGDD
jgi:hypothetical protein